MRPRQFAFVAVVPVAPALGAFAPGAEKKGEQAKKPAEENAAVGEKTGAELLESKGLRKSGQYFVLADEAALRKKLRELEPLRRKVFDAQKKADAADKVVDQKKHLINQCLQQRHDLEVQLNGVQNVAVHNRLVNAINELGDRIEILEKALKEDKVPKTLRAAATEIAEHYVRGDPATAEAVQGGQGEVRRPGRRRTSQQSHRRREQGGLHHVQAGSRR